MPARITLRDIAAQSGCTIATVSRALRNHPIISAATRARVRAVAAALKYVPDPALAALVEHRREMRQGRFLETLALISPELSWAETTTLPRRLLLIEAMREHARTLGYKLDFFHVPAVKARQEETARMFRRRRIRGLIFLPSSPPAESFAFPWDEFVAIRLFRPPLDFKITSVDTDIFQGVHLVLRALQTGGYTRPGLVISQLIARYSAGVWGLFFAMIASEWRALRPVRDFVFAGSVGQAAVRADFECWLNGEKPDVIVAFEAPDVADALRAGGWHVPDRVGLIDLDSDGGPAPKLAGLRQSRTAIGRTAIEHVHRLLLTNSLGLHEHPATVKTAFEWIDGPSVRKAPLADGRLPG